MVAEDRQLAAQGLERLDDIHNHVFISPVKRINEGHDVQAFVTTQAYRDIAKFLMQLNAAMFPRKKSDASVQVWDSDNADIGYSAAVQRLQTLVHRLAEIIDEAPPDPGPRRFGNASFRKWYAIVESRTDELLDVAVSKSILDAGKQGASQATARDELRAYLLGSFGSAQRLDYGTGHELSFLAFLGSLWKLGYFDTADIPNEERAIVLGVIDGYLKLIRRLITTYTLEPAGSHGVWGLDDHAFIPYIFGSAQLGPPMTEDSSVPVEGSREDAPEPSDVTKPAVVERERKRNLYFDAIGFIYDVKKGPFWEHSPILYDISGIRDGWGKVNKGMLKMYNAEVVSKFPVVQHFPFGSLYSWEQDPDAKPVSITRHVASQPSKPVATTMTPVNGTNGPRNAGMAGTAAPWASTARPSPPTASAGVGASTRAPWASRPTPTAMPPTRAPWAKER